MMRHCGAQTLVRSSFPFAAAAFALFGAFAPDDGSAATFRQSVEPRLGISVLTLEGKIGRGDSEKLQQALAAAPGAKGDLFVSLNSPGGELIEALDMAEMLRWTGTGTILLPGATCYSACSVVFFGGYDKVARLPRRIAMAGTRLGVHRAAVTLTAPPGHIPNGAALNAVFQRMQERLARTVAVLNRLDVSLEVQRRMFGTDNASISILTEGDLRATGVILVTGSLGAWRVDPGKFTAVALPPALRGGEAAARVAAGTGLEMGLRREAAVTVPVPSVPVPSVPVPSVPVPSAPVPPAPLLLQAPNAAPPRPPAPANARLTTYFGEVRGIALSWSKDFDCVLARSTAREFVSLRLCPERYGLSVAVDYRDGTFAPFSEWVPDFEPDGNTMIVEDETGNRAVNPMKLTRFDRGGVRFNATPWRRTMNFVGTPREIVLRMGKVALAMRPPQDFAAPMWSSVVARTGGAR